MDEHLLNIDFEAVPDEKLSEHLPPYEFETYPEKSREELSRAVGARYNYDPKAIEEWSAGVEVEVKQQEQEVEKVRQRVLASHLRFRGSE